VLENPREVHRTLEALTEFYATILSRGRRNQGLDGIFVTDDLGSQRGPLFSRETFRSIFMPHYREIIRYVHSLGMHFWLHSCGNIQVFLRDLIDIGVDVIHPIQKYTMDEGEIARTYGREICIWAGFDVQRILPFGEPSLIKGEVASLRDTFRTEGGRLILGLGNAVNAECTPERVALLCQAMTGGRTAGNQRLESAS
jgi:uroporphyrinogen-III decarboxylase